MSKIPTSAKRNSFTVTSNVPSASWEAMPDPPKIQIQAFEL